MRRGHSVRSSNEKFTCALLPIGAHADYFYGMPFGFFKYSNSDFSGNSSTPAINSSIGVLSPQLLILACDLLMQQHVAANRGGESATGFGNLTLF
mgnify:CR=1 FL=1